MSPEGTEVELIELLKGVELFAGLSDAQLRRLAAISRPVRYKDSEIIFAQGDEGDQLYIIREGQVEVTIGDDPETARSAVYLGRGQIFGEMALIDYGKRSATIRCVSNDAIIDTIKREDFNQLCAADTAIGYMVMRNLASDISFKLRHRNLNPASS
jgi:CRP-like cAMP-binding protein